MTTKITRRPSSTVQDPTSVWTKTGGATIHGILSDDSDSSYISSSQYSELPSKHVVFDIADVVAGTDIPAGAKIESVRLRQKVLQVAPSGGGSFGSGILFGGQIVQTIVSIILGGSLSTFLAHLFRFPCPPPAPGGSPGPQTVDYAYFVEKPSGGAWDLATFNALNWHIFRLDKSGLTSRIYEFYVDLNYNEQPTVNITGPTETRTLTDGVTANADATVTSSSGAFTANDIGAKISGAGIPANTTIASINSGTSIEMSANATASASGVTLTITRSVISTTTRPIVVIDYDDPDGDPQDAARFKLFTAAQVAAVGFDVETSTPFTQADWIPGQASQWLCNRELPNGDYTVFAQVRQKWTVPGDTPGSVGEFRSEWASYDFTVDVDGPPAPTLTVTPNDVADWMQIDLVAGTGGFATETYNVYYSDNAGVDWALVRGGYQVLAAGDGSAVLFDYTAPLNRTRWYKANAYRTLSGVKVASDDSEVALGTPNQLEFRFSDPLAPTLNMQCNLSDDQPEVNRSQGVNVPLTESGGKAYFKIVNGALGSQRGTMELTFVDRDDALWDRMTAIWTPGREILWKYPTGKTMWIMIGSTLKWAWRTDGATGVDFRICTFDYFEVAEPIDPNAPTT
jgi:hypothetical protein